MTHRARTIGLIASLTAGLAFVGRAPANADVPPGSRSSGMGVKNSSNQPQATPIGNSRQPGRIPTGGFGVRAKPARPIGSSPIPVTDGYYPFRRVPVGAVVGGQPVFVRDGVVIAPDGVRGRIRGDFEDAGVFFDASIGLGGDSVLYKPRRRSYRNCSYGYGYGYGFGYRSNYPSLVYDPVTIVVTSGAGMSVSSGSPQPGEYPPPVQAPVEVKPLTIAERAAVAMREGDTTRAIGLWRERLDEEPTDAGALRSLGFTYLADGQAETASALVREAYEMDPSLAWRPIAASEVHRGDKGLRSMLRTAVQHGHRTKTGSSWLVVAVTMQGEGRHDVARKMVDRGVDAGLGERIASELTRSLGG